ncbi:hypothetical protein BDQ17DRAFT_1031415 [Cyathus striatus]|nr:hypothetical protein BDQ17DRAFT_1031415 [Cyathus striatus]
MLSMSRRQRMAFFSHTLAFAFLTHGARSSRAQARSSGISLSSFVPLYTLPFTITISFTHSFRLLLLSLLSYLLFPHRPFSLSSITYSPYPLSRVLTFYHRTCMTLRYNTATSSTTRLTSTTSRLKQFV